VGPNLWNATTGGGLNAACLAATAPAGNQWQCAMAQYAYPYTAATVPFFFMQSLYDTAQHGFILQLGCEPGAGNCNATQLAQSQAYRVTLQAQIEASQTAFGTRDARFLTACNQHEGAS
jgi:hypothetical protein